MGVHVGPGVLGLSVLGENLGGNLVDGGNEVEEVVVGHVLEGELSLGGVSRIGLSENGVTVTGDDSSGLKGIPEVLLNVLLGDIRANLGLHLENPLKDLLVSSAVERTGKTVETSGQREEGRRESRADQLGGVGRDVTSLVISVDGEVKSEKLNELLVVAEAEEGGEVSRVVKRVVNGANDLSVLEEVSVDSRSNDGELGNEVHGILVGVLPVLLLVNTLLVSLGELRLRLQGVDGNTELGHGVESRGASVDELLNVLGDLGSRSPVSGPALDLSVSGDLAGEQKPEKTLGERLLSAGGVGKLLLEVGDGQTSESDALLGVEDGTLPDETLDTSHTTVSLVEDDLANDGVTLLLSELLDLLDVLGDELGESLLKTLIVSMFSYAMIGMVTTLLNCNCFGH